MQALRRYAPYGIGAIGLAMTIAAVAGTTAWDWPAAVAAGAMVAGFLVLAGANTLYVADRVDEFQRERPAAIALVWLGIGLANVGWLGSFGFPFETRVVIAGVGIALTVAGYGWNRRLLRAKGALDTDERRERLTYRATYRSWQLIVVLVVAVAGVVTFVDADMGVDLIPALVALVLVATLSRAVFYGYYERQL